jgi:hypothetical protein
LEEPKNRPREGGTSERERESAMIRWGGVSMVRYSESSLVGNSKKLLPGFGVSKTFYLVLVL